MNRVVIPTPRRSSFTGQDVTYSGLRVVNPGVAAPYALKLGRALLRAGGAPLKFASLEHASPQAYSIRIDSDGVSVRGASPVAFIYAMATLCQLADTAFGHITLPEGEILDWPEFARRGVNWNLFVEARIWSQDDGDGKDAFISRFTSALDTLAFFKLNAVVVDGFGWNPERFHGYGALMRELNAEARRRGIALCFGGYNAGYGAQWYDFDGPKFQNTREDGTVYPCIAPQMNNSIGATMGTCISNRALLEAKQENLRAYVKAVEPGLLYIHGIDVSTRDESIRAWASRCPECRRRWPDDTIDSPRGMAGAFADFYDALYDAITSVKNPVSGYDASRDCAVLMVSPNYSNLHESDDEWRFHISYFKVLWQCLRHKNMGLGLREQFFNYRFGRPRLAELCEAVPGAKVCIAYFSSGSSYYNSLPVTADAACIRCFSGVETVICYGGNAFQEPRQAVTAEYSWNPSGTRFDIGLPANASNETFLPLYDNLRHGRLLPPAVFGADGLLAYACRCLYGSKAAPIVAHLQTPSISHTGFDGPLSRIAPAAPILNKILPGSRFSIFDRQKINWNAELTEETRALASSYVPLMEEIASLSEEAADKYGEAAAECDARLPLRPEMRGTHLRRMSRTCRMGAAIARATVLWLGLFTAAAAHVFERQALPPDFEGRLAFLRKRLLSLIAECSERASGVIDPSGGDPGQAVAALAYIMRDINNIKNTIDTGTFNKLTTKTWW